MHLELIRGFLSESGTIREKHPDVDGGNDAVDRVNFESLYQFGPYPLNP